MKRTLPSCEWPTGILAVLSKSIRRLCPRDWKLETSPHRLCHVRQPWSHPSAILYVVLSHHHLGPSASPIRVAFISTHLPPSPCHQPHSSCLCDLLGQLQHGQLQQQPAKWFAHFHFLFIHSSRITQNDLSKDLDFFQSLV